MHVPLAVLTIAAVSIAGCASETTGLDVAEETTVPTVPVETAAPVEATAPLETAAPAEPLAACGAAFDLSVNDVERTDGRADPELEVTCDDESMRILSNNMIAYEYVSMTPNPLDEFEIDITIPTTPSVRSVPGAMGLGIVGVAINGVSLFAAFEAPRDGYRDPLSDGLVDFCNGHTAPPNLYHYHARPDCILDDPTSPGTVVGYLVDGYDVLVPWTADGTQVRSSYVKLDNDDVGAFTGWDYVEGSGDLDECNGMIGDDGEYHYYATDEFPYLPFCYHGVTDDAQGDFDGGTPG